MSTAVATVRGYRSPDVCHRARISYRQLDHLARTYGLGPTIADAAGSGTARLYGRADVAALLAWRELRAVCVESERAAMCAMDLRDRGALDDVGRDHPDAPVVLRGVGIGRADLGPVYPEPFESLVVVWPDWSRLDD
jgi:hypothetical protein